MPKKKNITFHFSLCSEEAAFCGLTSEKELGHADLQLENTDR